MLELFIAYANTKDIPTRNALVKLNLNLARKVAHKASKICHEPYADLEQEAAIGLIKAVERFNPHLGNAFSSFAVPFINGKILQYLRDKGHLIRLSQSVQNLNLQGKKAAAQLRNQLGRCPSLKEIANYLQVNIEEYESAINLCRNSKDYFPIDIESENLLSIDEEEGWNIEVINLPSSTHLNLSSLSVEEVGILSRKKSSKRSLWKKMSASNC